MLRIRISGYSTFLHDITEILLKMALNSLILPYPFPSVIFILMLLSSFFYYIYPCRGYLWVWFSFMVVPYVRAMTPPHVLRFQDTYSHGSGYQSDLTSCLGVWKPEHMRCVNQGMTISNSQTLQQIAYVCTLQIHL